MAVSTLSKTRADIKVAVRRYLQWSLTGSLTTDQSTTLDDIIESGENMFYKGTILPGENSIHVWSFLTRKITIAITADDYTYNLDDDFGGFVENFLSFDTTDNAQNRVEITSMEELDRLRSMNLTVSLDYPTHAAVENRTRDQTTEQRFELQFWPTPAVSATAYGRIFSNPSAITDASLYPLGGQPHGQTLLQACLAAAELYVNDGVEGVHMQNFLRMMADSVKLDRSLTTPKYFGRNTDGRQNTTLSRRHLARGVIYDP